MRQGGINDLGFVMLVSIYFRRILALQELSKTKSDKETRKKMQTEARLQKNIALLGLAAKILLEALDRRMGAWAKV